MRVINIVDNIEAVNFGIWNAAIATAQQLTANYQVVSEIWFPKPSSGQLPPTSVFNTAQPVSIINLAVNEVDKIIQERKLNPESDIIVTHGTWRYATGWGHALKRRGFKWVYVPHGMLEPWSMQQKKLKKLIYFYLFEYRFAKKADVTRAVGSPELKNLSTKFSNLVLIPNGVPDQKVDINNRPLLPIKVLFMARLHAKKGILPLVNGWIKSVLNNDPQFQLVIAGPDDGELAALQQTLTSQTITNIAYVGPVYGEAKHQLLSQCHYYILPSYSEGFPTSVVEAMQFGLIPMISDGCNFPEAFESKLAIKVTPFEKDITAALNNLAKPTHNKQQRDLAVANQYFVQQNYSVSEIAQEQYELYKKLLAL